jgi:hypothetical protein
MAQIIKHKRGNLEGLASATTRAGELLVVTGSTGLGSIANGGSLVFVGIDGSTATPVNKILQGTTVPNLTGESYNTYIDGIPFFDTDDQKLYILNKGGNIEVKATPQTGGSGIVSGSSQIDADSITNFDANVLAYNNSLNVISGSSQVTITESQISDLTHYTDADVKLKLDADAVISGSASDVKTFLSISESDISDLTHYTDADVKLKLDADAVISGSAQVVASLVNQATDFGTGRVSGDDFGNVAGDSTFTGSFVGDGSGLTGLATNLTVNTADVDLLADDLDIVGTANEIEISTDKVGNDVTVTIGIPSNPTLTGNVTVTGDLLVSGTRTIVDSATLDISGSLIRANYGGGAVEGGIEITDATGGGLATGSLLWDGTNDYWKGGAKGSEIELASVSGTQTLTNKTINASQLINTTVSNAKLVNDGITIAGVDTSLGGTITASTIGLAIGTLVSGSSQVVLQDADKTGFTGASSITTLGTIATGVWNGTAIAKEYLDDEVLNASLNSYTASNDTTNSGQDSRLDQLSAFTASVSGDFVDTAELAAATGALETVDAAQTVRLDQFATETGSIATAQGVQDGRLTNIEGFTSSIDTTIKTKLDADAVISGSVQVVASLVNQATDFGTGRVSGDNFGDVAGTSTMTGSFVGDGSSLTGLVSTLGVSGSTGNGSISLKTQELSIVGTANEIETSVSGQTITVGIVTNPTLTGDVTITGNLMVEGTTTTIDSTTVNIGDRILELNYAGDAGNAGLLVSDVDGSSTVSGSLLWNGTDGADYWMAGKLGSEKEIATLNAAPTSNRVLKANSDGLLVDSTITDDGTDVSISGDLTVTGLTAGANGAFLYADANEKLQAVDASTAGDVIQWNGTSFVASNEIDGGTF